MLGLSAGEPVTHDRLRRAYLRRLRAHPPERDPDGFRQLREAFEQLEPWARMHDHIQAAESEPSGAPAHSSDEPDRSGAPPCVAEPAKNSEAAPWTAESDSPEAAANVDPPGDPGGRGNPPLDDEPSVARESETSEAVAGRAPTADPPATLSGVTDEILALFQAGKLDAALELAHDWRHSVADDHREVSPHDAQRWALTRELLDVAPELPDSLRRAVARGIATDNLAAECSATEVYQALSSAQAVDLARYLARHATNLFKVLVQPLQSRVRLRDTPGVSSLGNRVAILAGLVIVAALLQAVRGCEHTPHNTIDLDRMPAPGELRLDPELVRRLELQSQPQTEEPDSNQRLELRPEGAIRPSQP